MKKKYLALSFLVYVLFIAESITGYWVEKPRAISVIFFNLLERGTAYQLHVNVLPIILYITLFFHTTIALKRYYSLKMILFFNLLIFLCLIFLHIL